MRARSRAPWIVGACGVPVFAGAMVLSVLNGSFSSDPSLFLIVPMIVCYTAVGALVASREPRNLVGWLIMTVGVGLLLGGVTDEYTLYTYETRPGALPFGSGAAWLSSWVFPVVGGTVPLLLALFPTGTVPSRGWRPFPHIVVTITLLATITTILNPAPLDFGDGILIENPTGVGPLRGVGDAAGWVFGLGFIAMAIASVVALAQRFHRSSGEERQQIRWFAYAAIAASVALLGIVAAGVASGGESAGGESAASTAFLLVFFASVGIGLPAALGVAMLRYRLYDLELVVKKTVLYTTVAALLTAVFLIVAVVVGGIVGRSQTGAVVAAAAIGLAFWPATRVARRVADRVVYGRRATPYEILADFSHRLGGSYASEDVLVRMARVLNEALGASRAAVWLRVGSEIRPAAAWPDKGVRPAPVPSAGDRLPPLPVTWAEEVRDRGELLGALAVDMPPNDPMDPSRQRLVRALASQAGLVLRNVRLIEELKASRQRLVAAQDEERRRLERNIHDGAQQQLVALAVKLRLAEAFVDRDAARAKATLAELQGEAQNALEDLRDLARGIYPPLLADQGLTVALSAQIRKAALPVDLQADRVGRYSQETEAAVYFCTLEALNNVAKYAGASKASVRLFGRNGELRFEITDDGTGFDTETTPQGTGLTNMADRLAALGGILEITSRPGTGTTVTGSLPVPVGEPGRGASA